MSDNKTTDAQLGRSHPLVKRIRLLSRSPAQRSSAGLMVAEGLHLAEEALGQQARIHEAIVSPRLQRDARGADLLARLRAAGVSIRQATDLLLASLHEAESHQGILLIVERPGTSIPHLISSADSGALVLVACGVQDPGNLGALVRLADAAGATAMFCAGGADPFGPKAARASAGSIFR
ncbi:MAG TPA: TrmH family RNA methyltransferase, partial [Patescibacteria group bacterium]|nr:TrmH family RNA methyltransferase [Patescibacteria group bacterium]